MVVTPGPESHSRLFSPRPTTVRALHFYREKTSAISSLVGSRRIVPTHTTLGALSSCSFLFIFASKFKNLTTAGFELQDQH